MESTPKLISLRDHPRAGPGIRRAKAWGGIAGFALVMLAGTMAGGTVVNGLLRALIGGVVGYVVVWVAAQMVWSQLLRAEATNAARRAAERRREAAEGVG
ncbi:MAG: hypothetical protein QOD86_972 [Miltoncostaeaceae bacterium]|jgi:uncharacterized membrane protein YfcA|nr:hypothetical protein [Miltoncostaeaceae bacterium]